MALLQRGDFVRVKVTSDFRPGHDGMVVAEDDGEAVGLMFGYDRYNRSPSETGTLATGSAVEEWMLDELDLSSIDR